MGSKVSYQYLYTSGDMSISDAFDAITIYDRPVMVYFDGGGKVFGMFYKYTGAQYGMGLVMHYYTTDIQVLSVVHGTKTVGTIGVTS